jgi:hypothetical protein
MKLAQLKEIVRRADAASRGTQLVHVPRVVKGVKDDRIGYPHNRGGGGGGRGGKHVVLVDTDEGFVEYAMMDDEGNIGPMERD